MTLYDAIAAELPRLRAEALARMTSTATVHRKTDNVPQDEDSGLEGTGWEAVATDSPFRLKGNRGASASQTMTIGGVEVTLALREGHFPVDVVLADGDFVEVTSGENAGTVWRVVDGDWADQQTARRVPLVAADRPEEWA